MYINIYIYVYVYSGVLGVDALDAKVCLALSHLIRDTDWESPGSFPLES